MSGEHHPLVEELFLEQVERYPEAIALVEGEVRLTYRELHRRAGRIAAGLVARGVGRESIVAMAFERSADAIVATLAIVMAGGAYLPLNPSFPGERLAHMIADSGTELAICGQGIALAGVPNTTLAELDTDAQAPVPAEWDGSPLAYVMYTSGSTGRPKGVLVEQAGIVRLVKDSDFFRFDAGERLLLTGALEFDAATFEIWGCLLNGATLHVAGKETLLVPDALKNALRDNGITVMWLTAPLFGQLAEHDAGTFAGLRTLLVGGDVVHRRHVAQLHARFPELRVINGYGPTENTTFTTTYEIPPGGEGDIPIGRPLNQTTVKVLDERRHPADQGELYTGGAGLARGYLNNPELTAEKFVVIDGERYYRTGDRVTVDADGLIWFHGRVDDQVKIRGHRVEVKETESVLLRCAGVVEGCVIVSADDTGKFLSAYVVLAPDTGLLDVTAELATKLPEYMRPEHVVVMERLPLNPNGKVDKAKLPRPRTEQHDHSDLPEGQRQLATLWAEVLRAGRIRPSDDFFELGGNSLAVGALLGRLAARHGVHLPFKEVFANRTLAAMADAVSKAATRELAPIHAVPDGVPSELHPQQRGLHTHWQVDEKSLAYNVPVRLDITGPVTPRGVREALAELVDRHDALRTRFVGTRQVADSGVTVQLVESQYMRDEDVVRAFVRPFDLTKAPLVRALLVRVDHARHRLYLDVHHVVFDGVSLGILVSQLTDLLAGVRIGTPRWRYADASQWCADRIADGTFAADGRYWLETLADPPRLDLPTDHPRPEVRRTAGATVRRKCSNEQVRRIAQRAGTTDFVALLSAYSAVLMRLSGQRDIVVGSPTSGRVHPDFDGVVGMFVNTAALRIGIDEQASLTDLVHATKQRHAEALEHQAFPFDDVVAGLGLPRDPSRLPLLDAFFALQNIDFYTFERDELRVEVELLHPHSCRFDLNLQAYQRPEGIVLELEHNTSLFTTASAEYLLSRVTDLLDELDSAPDHAVFDQPASIGATSTAHADFTF
ncbi:amino acid adenylation domain-containing protein [Lentzea tibetensis]|nr:amino acid adenylation domain-containing protein [Lentzea tibetensis]